MKKHRCDIEGKRCEFHSRTSPPDCDDWCEIQRTGVTNWAKYRQTYPTGCPFAPFTEKNRFAVKTVIDKALKHCNKRASLRIGWD